MPRSLACPLAVSLLLAGCGAPGPQFPPACPALSLLHGAADLARYAGQDRDLRELVLQARIAAVPAKCSWEDGGRKVKAALQVTVEMTRGPAASGRQASVPYFVGVVEGDTVMDKQDYTLPVAFPPNTDHASFTSDAVTMLFPVSAGKSAAAYHIYVGFLLSPQELLVNRQDGGG